jgi:hypothetical protein
MHEQLHSRCVAHVCDAQDIDDPLYGNIGGQQEQLRSECCT